jgi:hypothetical protein
MRLSRAETLNGNGNNRINLRGDTEQHFRKATVPYFTNGYYLYFVIPGLTRNPVRFQTIIFLDAGSSPA